MPFRGLDRPPVEHPPLGLHQLTRSDLAGLMHTPFLMAVVVGLAMEPFYFTLVNQYVPNLAREAHGFTETSIATLVALGRLPSLLTLWFVARWIDRGGNPFRYYGTGMLVSATLTLLVAWAPSGALFVLGFLLYWASQGVVWGANTTRRSTHLRHAGQAAGASWLFTVLCVAQAASG